jgi:FtsP/CotA-like multicopper oxidase with cupredoxin domain
MMNRSKQMLGMKLIWLSPILLLILLAAAHLAHAVSSSGTSQGGVKHFDLYATDGYLQLPGGQQVYIWGYSLENKKGSAVYPAPTLEVNEGDEVHVTLTNIGPAKEGIKRLAHTIHWHGLDTNQANDGVPHTAPAIQVGESFTYQFKATHAGTYFYHCHVDTVEHLQMGMHGAFVVHAKDGAKQAWTDGPAFDKQYVFHLNEIDPVWHKAVEEGKPYDRTNFHPRYWTINGKAFPDTMGDPEAEITGNVGETVLVRIVNSGYQTHAFHLHGHHFKVVASDGRPLQTPIEKDTINIGAGERYDLLVTFTQSGDFPFHSHNIIDNTNNGIYPGGMHTMTLVSPAVETVTTTITMKAGEARVKVDGGTVDLEVAPQLIDSTTFVPLRFIGNQFGAGIEWLDQERSVIYTLDAVRIQLWIDQPKATINGEELALTMAPVIVDGTSMVPLRFVTENLGAALDYNPADGTITIRYKSVSRQQGDTHGPASGHGSHHPDSPSKEQVSSTPPVPAEEGTTIISIGNSSYSIKELRIKQGMKVTWVNDDIQIHTVTELNNKFNSGNMAPKGKWSRTFDQKGTFIYYCSTHPSMEAKVIVE